MTRNNARELAIHLIFAMGFGGTSAEELLQQSLTKETFAALGAEEPLYKEFPNESQHRYIVKLVTGVAEHGAELDSYIEKYAIGWAFSRISRIAASIMRVGMYEILYLPDVPAGAAINEAVEIAKHYESPETAAFINGILGTFLREEMPPERAAEAETPVAEEQQPPENEAQPVATLQEGN